MQRLLLTVFSVLYVSFLITHASTAKAFDVQFPRTGQTSCYNSSGTAINCTTLGQTQDAAMSKGVSWNPTSRFSNNNDGTITDNLTGLIWLQNANCTDTVGGIARGNGDLTWGNSLIWSKGLANGSCGLSDGTIAGDWRLPNLAELESLVDLQASYPAIPTGHPFINVQSYYYWSSSNYMSYESKAWVVGMIDGGADKLYKNEDYIYVWPVRGGQLDPLKIVPPTPKVTFLSENLPDGSYQVGAATKVWRFKNGSTPISGLKAVHVEGDCGLGISQYQIELGDVAANSEFYVSVPINPFHEGCFDGISVRSSYWKFVDGTGLAVTITNSQTGQFWLKIKTNRDPEFSQLQLESVSGSPDPAIVSLPILASDPDGDSLTYSVVSGGGSVVSGTWQGKSAMLYQHTFPASAQTVYPVEIQVGDGHGGTAKFTIQAVIAPNGKIREFYKDTPYPSGGDPATTCDRSTTPPTFTPNSDQYQAIHYLTLKGIVIGTPDTAEPAKRNFDGCSFASQAEALAMIMKSANLRGLLELDAEARWLPNLVVTDVDKGIFKNYSWAAPYVLKAEALGMIPSADTFNPSTEAKRGWMATLMARMLKLGTPMDAIDPATYLFADSATFSTPAANSEALAVAYFGYMLGEWGSTVSFNPADSMVRADVAMVASKILRSPAATAIETSGLTTQTLFGKQLPATIHGQTFNVTGVTTLTGSQIVVDSDGYVYEGINNQSNYTTAKIIRPGSGVVGTKLVYSLANTPVVVPTVNPDIPFNEERSIVAVLESVDWNNKNPVRNVVRLNYGVIFPDADGDGVRDNLDLWPNNSLFSTDANGNGIPDNADALWNLSARNRNDVVIVNGQSVTLVNAVLNNALVNDQIAPTTAISPAGGTYTAAQTVSLTANETATIRCTTDGSTPTIASPICSTAIPVNSDMTVNYFAVDLAGNSEVPKQAAYVISASADTTKPTLVISTLDDGSVTSNATLNISGTATDNDGIAQVTINGAPATLDQNGGFSQAITLTTGLNTIIVLATDAANNTTTITRAITHDLTAPELSVTAPADNSYTNKTFATVSGTVGANASVNVVVPENSVNQAATLIGTNFNATVNLAPGLNTIIVTATDLAGNSSQMKRSVTSDTLAPTLAITNPLQDELTTVADYTVSGSSADSTTPVTIALVCDGQIYTPHVIDGTFSQQLSFTMEKQYAVVATATDAAGNSATVQRNIIYTPKSGGDINGDGKVDISDALRALHIAVGLATATAYELEIGDVAPLVNGAPHPDGVIDVGDAFLILRKSVGLVAWSNQNLGGN